MNEAGNSTFERILEITTFLSSIGPRSASVTVWGICPNSSRNSTPLHASDTSPGVMLLPEPPPIIAAREAEQCGALNGRSRSVAPRCLPATE